MQGAVSGLIKWMINVWVFISLDSRMEKHMTTWLINNNTKYIVFGELLWGDYAIQRYDKDNYHMSVNKPHTKCKETHLSGKPCPLPSWHFDDDAFRLQGCGGNLSDPKTLWKPFAFLKNTDNPRSSPSCFKATNCIVPASPTRRTSSFGVALLPTVRSPTTSPWLTTLSLG